MISGFCWSANRIIKSGLCAFLLAGALAGCCKQPDAPLKLELKLAKHQWELGEYPWYRLEMTNVGCKKIAINRDFWQYKGPDRADIYFLITDSEGKEIKGDRRAYGFHGERYFWTYDCGEGRDCKEIWDKLPKIELKPGRTVEHTPSMVRPIRYERHVMDDPGDPRATPYFAYKRGQISRERYEGMRKEWEKTVNDRFLMGDIRFSTDSEKALAAVPKGYRILHGFDAHFEEPGTYKIKVLYAPLGLDATRELALRRIAGESLASIGKRLSLFTDDEARTWLRLAKTFVFESNTVEFEVVRTTWTDEGRKLDAVLKMSPEERQRHMKDLEAGMSIMDEILGGRK